MEKLPYNGKALSLFAKKLNAFDANSTEIIVCFLTNL